MARAACHALLFAKGTVGCDNVTVSDIMLSLYGGNDEPPVNSTLNGPNATGTVSCGTCMLEKVICNHG